MRHSWKRETLSSKKENDAQQQNVQKKKIDGEGRGQETEVVPVVQQGALKTFHLEPSGEIRQDFCLDASSAS